MSTFFDPTPEQRKALDDLIDEIPGIQRTLVNVHDMLKLPDRVAHQQQIAGSKVLLKVAEQLPRELDGLGVFQRESTGEPPRVGIGRISTGLGCPHAETTADFLGLMVAFRGPSGRRNDFITINDPTSPTDTPKEFVALLKATADAAASSNPFASQARLLFSLARHAGLKAPTIATHVLQQTLRTVHSSTAYQQYWTGIVRARDVLGKFTFVPATAPPAGAPVARTEDYLSRDWTARQSKGPLEFTLRWIPFINTQETSLSDLTRPWREDQSVSVGTVTFPMNEPEATSSKLTALLASEMGANPGNWDEIPDGQRPALPATEFTAARFLAYRASQRGRGALPEEQYEAFFRSGEIDQELARELVRRFNEKRAMGHVVPAIGQLPDM